MVNRTFMIVALGAALLGGAVSAAHASSTSAPRAATVHADLVLSSVSDQTADTDPTAPCTGQGTAAEAGDCTDSQNTTGPEDSTSAPGTGETTGPDTDTTQSGP